MTKRYTLRGFQVAHALVDGQFVTMEASLNEMGITLTTASNAEYIGEIEHMIRIPKERVRGRYNTSKRCLADSWLS